MRSTEETVLTVDDTLYDSKSMNEAAIAGDFDEARFCSQLIVAKADASGHQDLVLAAAFVMDRLGPPGSVPRSGFAEGMLRVAEELDKIGVNPL